MPHDNTSPTAEAGGLLDHRPCKCWGATLHVSEQTWESDGVIHHRDRPCERIAAAAAAAADPISPEPEPPAVEARHYRKDQWSHADIERGYRQWNIVAPGDQAFAAGVFAETGIPTFTEDEIDEMVAAVDADNGYEVDRTELIARTGMSEDEIAGYREAVPDEDWFISMGLLPNPNQYAAMEPDPPNWAAELWERFASDMVRRVAEAEHARTVHFRSMRRYETEALRAQGALSWLWTECSISHPGVSDHFLERIVRHGMGTSE